MLLESKFIELGEGSYQITQFTATKGLRFLRKITKYISPLVSLMGSEQGDKQAVTVAIESLMDNLGDDDLDKLIMEMVEASAFVSSDGNPVKFDFFFAGDYGKLIKLITEIFNFNFESVFQEGVFGDLSAKMTTQIPTE